jgi:putative flippase GtrA
VTVFRRALEWEATRFLRFSLVGGAGFAVDAGLLAALHAGAGVDPFTARLVSMSAAAFSTWRLNRALTFGASASTQAAEGARYAIVATLTACLNYGLYALLILLWPGLPPVAAAVAATGLAMTASYLGYSRFVFAAGASAVLGGPSSHRR